MSQQHYLVDQANMITIIPLKKVLDSFPSVRTALSSASLFFLLPFFNHIGALIKWAAP